MSDIQKVSTGLDWEEKVGYSRAIRVGNLIEVSGTIAYSDGKVEAVGDSYRQTIAILNKIDVVLKELGASMNNVIRTRIYVTDINLWTEVGKAHGLFFKDIKPATSMVEVCALIEKEALVEIEATAFIETNSINKSVHSNNK